MRRRSVLPVLNWPSVSGLLLALALVLGPAVSALAASPSTTTGKPAAKTVKKAPPARSAAGKAKGKPAAAAKSGKHAPRKGTAHKVARAAPAVPSYGQIQGLRQTTDELDLKSSVALVVDQETDEVLFSKNPSAVLPIASITKLMTALVVAEAKLDMEEPLTVTHDDISGTAGSHARSRLVAGTRLSRGEMLHLALMSSENRAAHLLGRTYPGGLVPFVEAMNRKAADLGMNDTHYVEPTGLNPNNQSSAQDLARLVRAASEYPLIRELSTSQEAVVPVGHRPTQFRNTNGLVHNPEWDIGLQKTGYISAAGRCVVMQAQLAGRKLIMVLLDSAGKYSRIGDAERLRHWLASAPMIPAANAAPLVPAATAVQPPR